MSLCVLCAQPLHGDADVCAFHVHGVAEDWATGNRIMCDFLHRGIVAPGTGEDAHAFTPVVELFDEAVSP